MLCAFKKSLILASLLFTSLSLASSELALEKLDSEQVLVEQFQTALKNEIVAKMGLPENLFQVKVENFSTVPHIDFSKNSVDLVEIFGVGTGGSSRLDGLLSVPANIKLNKTRIEEVTLSAAVKVTGPVWVAAENLHRGEVINRQKLRLTQLPWSRVPTHVLMTRAEDLEGRSIKYAVQKGAFVSVENLGRKDMIKNGEAVSLTIQSGPGVFIRSRAIAKQGGKLGDIIRVEQPQTKKTVRAVVVGSKKVEVQL